MRLIDADTLMDVIGIAVECEGCSRNGVFGCGEDSAFVYACESTTDAPTVDPVKHGNWIDDYNAEEDPFFRKGWKCSVCGFRTSYGKPKYCMNCGARMDGESNEID